MIETRPLPPPAGSGNTKKKDGASIAGTFKVSDGVVGGPQRVLIYGPGGIGKSTLASLAPKPVFIDIESGTRFMDVPRIDGVYTFDNLIACLQSQVLTPYQTVILDSATKAEEWAVTHTLNTVKNSQGNVVDSVEGYGYGKGYQHVYETFLSLMANLDAQIEQGRNVVLIAHDCTAEVPNPNGDDYIRFEPFLQSMKSGKSSIRSRVIQWADYVLFVGYDVISEGGKGLGGGTRTIFTVERPDHIAKSRTAIDPIEFAGPNDNRIWQAIQNGGSNE